MKQKPQHILNSYGLCCNNYYCDIRHYHNFCQTICKWYSYRFQRNQCPGCTQNSKQKVLIEIRYTSEFLHAPSLNSIDTHIAELFRNMLSIKFWKGGAYLQFIQNCLCGRLLHRLRCVVLIWTPTHHAACQLHCEMDKGCTFQCHLWHLTSMRST